jgi:hypothetical protein
MSFTRSIVTAGAVVLLVTLPTVAGAQERQRTACNDGTTTPSVASTACDGHGGIHKGNTAVLRRSPATAPKRSSEPARVSQAGTPASIPAPSANKPHYEERRGWRWRRHRDESSHAEKKERWYRCRDGKEEKVHGKAKGKEICKHHGGIAS